MCLVAGGCRSIKKTPAVAPAGDKNIAKLEITSPAFRDGEAIPQKYTCDGADVSPDLNWSAVPSGVTSMALIVDDPDAPGGTWVHWVLFNIPPETMSLPEGVLQASSVEGVGMQGRNGSGNTGYNGPCPPKGKPHHYYFKLYALDSTLDLKPGASKTELEKAMQGHILAEGQFVGTYGR